MRECDFDYLEKEQDSGQGEETEEGVSEESNLVV